MASNLELNTLLTGKHSMFKIDISIHNIKDITDCLGISAGHIVSFYHVEQNLKINVSGFIANDSSVMLL